MAVTGIVLVSMGVGLLSLVALVVLIAVMYSALEIVDPYGKKVLMVRGEYQRLLEPGLNVVPPFVSRTYMIDMRTQTLDIPRQEAFTRDNASVTADAVVYIRVIDAKKAFLESSDYKRAIADRAQTTLRAVLADLDIERDGPPHPERLGDHLRLELTEPAAELGLDVGEVEISDVTVDNRENVINQTDR